MFMLFSSVALSRFRNGRIGEVVKVDLCRGRFFGRYRDGGGGFHCQLIVAVIFVRNGIVAVIVVVAAVVGDYTTAVAFVHAWLLIDNDGC